MPYSIVAACLLIMLSFGYRSSFGLFVKPVTEANGRRIGFDATGGPLPTPPPPCYPFPGSDGSVV